MSDFQKIKRNDTNAIFATELQSIPVLVRNLMDQLQRVVDRGFHLKTNGETEQDPVDFSEFETVYGVAPGAGQEIFDMCNGALNDLKNGQGNVLKDRVG